MKKFLGFLLVIVLGAGTYFYIYNNPQRKALRAAQTAAEQGDADAQLALGKIYVSGQGVPPSAQTAADWFSRSAAQGNAQAAYELARLYLSGEQLPRDVDGGLSYLKLSAEKGYSAAQYMLGRLYQTGAENLEPNPVQAVFWWIQAAAQDDADAQNELNDAQNQTPEIYEQARHMNDLRQAAVQGDGQAALTLARAYQIGQPLAQNTDAAAQWFLKAAEQNLPQAQYELALLYGADEGPLPKDEAKVLQYLEQAAQSGYAPAQYALGEKIYQSAQTPEDFQKALDWFGQAAKQNHAGALYMCGIMYMQGQGTQASIPQAIAAFKQAADLGHANAQYVVGQSYWRGIGLRPSKSKALQWLELAKQNGNAQAEALIAEINAGK